MKNLNEISETFYDAEYKIKWMEEGGVENSMGRSGDAV